MALMQSDSHVIPSLPDALLCPEVLAFDTDVLPWPWLLLLELLLSTVLALEPLPEAVL